MGVNLAVDPNTAVGIVLGIINEAFLYVYTVEITMKILYFDLNIIQDSLSMFDIFVVVVAVVIIVVAVVVVVVVGCCCGWLLCVFVLLCVFYDSKLML